MADGKRINRVMTQKYDMQSLRQLQTLETNFVKALAEIYGCAEEDIPAEIDMFEVSRLEASARESAVREGIKDIPVGRQTDIDDAVKKLLTDMETVDINKNLKDEK